MSCSDTGAMRNDGAMVEMSNTFLPLASFLWTVTTAALLLFVVMSIPPRMPLGMVNVPVPVTLPSVSAFKIKAISWL